MKRQDSPRGHGFGPLLAAGILTTNSAFGGIIFSEDFDGLAGGIFNGGQYQSNLAVAYGGSVPGWSKSGGNAVHVVDTANVFPSTVNPRDFAVMVWHDNVITQSTAIAGSNVAGMNYSVDFDASPAVYQASSQATWVTDGLLIEVLRGDNSVLDSYTHLPGAWAGNTILVPDSFQYTGDGTGDIRLRIGPSAFLSNRFGGAIDNVSVSAVATPEASEALIVLVGMTGLLGVRRRRR